MSAKVTKVWFAGVTFKQNLVALNGLDGRDQLNMIALFMEDVVGV